MKTYRALVLLSNESGDYIQPGSTLELDEQVGEKLINSGAAEEVQLTENTDHVTDNEWNFVGRCSP